MFSQRRSPARRPPAARSEKAMRTRLLALALLAAAFAARAAEPPAAEPGGPVPAGSVPGALWTRVLTKVTWPSRDGHAALVFRDRLWVLGGWGTGPLQDVWTSPDGSTGRPWARRHGRPARPTRASCSRIACGSSAAAPGGPSRPTTSGGPRTAPPGGRRPGSPMAAAQRPRQRGLPGPYLGDRRLEPLHRWYRRQRSLVFGSIAPRLATNAVRFTVNRAPIPL